MRFGILGPTQARAADGTLIAVGGRRTRRLLALLLLDTGHMISTDRLIDDLYGENPPEKAANALQAQVSRLRRRLGGELIEGHPAGYRIKVDAEQVDVHRFTRLAGEGRKARGQPVRGSRHVAQRGARTVARTGRGTRATGRAAERTAAERDRRPG